MSNFEEAAAVYEETRKAFEVSRNAVGNAAEAMLAGAVAAQFPTAVAYLLHGDFEGETLFLNITGVRLADGTLIEDDDEDTAETGSWTDLTDTTGEYLLFLAMARDEELAGEHWLNVSSVVCECGDGFLLNQTYGEADIPEGWVPVQACDACRRFETDEAAAVHAAAVHGSTDVREFPGSPPDENGGPGHDEWAIRLGVL